MPTSTEKARPRRRSAAGEAADHDAINAQCIMVSRFLLLGLLELLGLLGANYGHPGR